MRTVEDEWPVHRQPVEAELDSPMSASPQVAPRLASDLVVGPADDPAEHAADRFADDLIAALKHPNPVPAGPGRAMRRITCSAMSTTHGGRSQTAHRLVRAVAGGGAPVVGLEGGALPATLHSDVRASRGTPLDRVTRTTMETATGTDLGHVRIHRNSAVAPKIQAAAFTVGHDIHFAPGNYHPHDDAGKRLLGHELGHVMQQDGGATRQVVHRFVETQDVDGEDWRVSESGKTGLWVTQAEGGQSLYARPELIKKSNRALRKAGQNGSFVRLATVSGTALKKDLVPGLDPAVRRVEPRLFVVGPDPGNKKMEAINSGKAADDDGSQNAEFALWADCGRSSRAVMGTDGTGTGLSAHRKIGDVDAVSAPGYNPAAYTDIYLLAIKSFMKLPENKKYLQEGIHYTKILAWKSMVKPTTDKHAKKLYWGLGEKGRKAFDKYTKTNTAANPEIGGGYTMATEKTMPGFASNGKTWNFHWAAVVLKDGSNNVTLENYAVSYGTSNDPVEQKRLAQLAYDEVNRKYVWQMYGTKKKGQTFHDEHLASGTHGNRGSSFAVKAP